MNVMVKYRKYSSGQVLLIVVITMVVALTAGLSLASRTITNLKLSKQNEDSQRAFQAASAGVDKYINASSGQTYTSNLSNSNFTTTVTTVTGNILLLNNGDPVDQDRGIDVWLSTYPNYAAPLFTGSITMYWGGSTQIQCGTNSGIATRPAIEVLIVYGSVATPTVQKYVYDRCGRVTGTGVLTGSNPSGSVFNGVTFDTITAAPISISNGLIMKIIPLYNSSIIGLNSPSMVFPPQGKVIQSTGTSGDSARKIVYFESYPQIPNEIFPYAILSQ